MTSPSDGDVTGLLLQWSEGRPEAREKLIPLVYRELRALANRSLRAERSDHTLQPTALVHEAYEKLVDQRSVHWQGRAHFFAVAAALMRRILLDHARRRLALRRGGGPQRVQIDEELVAGSGAAANVDIIALDDALTALAELDAGQARIVELRFFAGLSLEETAEVVESSRATVHREWSMARAWLHRRLTAT